MDILSVQKHVRFRLSTAFGDYVDAVILPENATVDPVAIEAIATARAAAWVQAVTNVPLADDVPLVDLQAQQDDLAQQALRTKAQIDEVQLPPDTVPPSMPTDVRYSIVNGTVQLTWRAATDQRGVVGYSVYRDNPLVVMKTAVTRYTDFSVLPGLTYRYRIAALDRPRNESTKTTALVVTIPSGT